MVERISLWRNATGTPKMKPANKTNKGHASLTLNWRTTVCRVSLLLYALLALLPYAAKGQSSTTTARTPGTPTGSYKLGDADTINLFTGNLNYSLPLLGVGGRGGAQANLGVVIEGQWNMQEIEQPNGFYEHQYSFHRPAPLALVGYVVLDISFTDTHTTCANGNQLLTYRAAMTYVEPDGTEVSLRDRVLHSRPENVCSGGSMNLGRIFESTSGSFVTYVSDTDIYLSCFGISGCTDAVDGYLYFPNGTKSRVTGGRIDWTQDRNGNKIRYDYDTNYQYRLVKITDSIGREVNIDYDVNDSAPYGLCDRIRYKGFGGQEKIIRVSFDNDLNNLLRRTRPYDPASPINTVYDDPNDNVSITYSGVSAGSLVKAVWLPDGRGYQFKYNSLAQLARVDLPTGGALEYDFEDASRLPFEAPPNTGVNPNITNRVAEKRVYASGDVLVGRTAFSVPATYTTGVIPPSRGGVVRDTELFDPNGNRLSKSRHYFYGSPDAQYSLVVPWWHGKEFRTETIDADNSPPLRVVETVWRQTVPSWCASVWPCSADPNEQAPTNNPFVAETKTTLGDGNLVSKVSGINPSNGTYAFDAYNNQTDVWQYDYGVGQAGALLKHTHISYINNANPLGGIYLLGLTDTTSTYSVGDSGQETLAASTQILYDEYTQYALLTYDTVTGWQEPGTIRGNPTTVKQWLDTDNSWVETHAQFDQLGNVRKSWDALGRLTETSFTDLFTDEVSRNTYAFATLSTSPIPDAGNDHGSNAAFTTHAVYDYSSGLVRTTTNINDKTTTFEYVDGLDRLTKVINPPGGGSTSYTYMDTVGNLYVKTTTAFDETRNIEAYSYFDDLGRSVRSFSAKGNGIWVVSDTQYDAANRVARASKPYETSQAPSLNVGVNPSNNWVTTEYDTLGRIKTVTSADGSQSSISYTGATTTFTDAALRKRMTDSDALGRLKQVTEDPDGVALVTKYKYDILGNLRGVDQGPPGQPQQQQHRYYAYDSLSRLVRSRNPEQDTNPDLVLKDVYGNPINDPITGNGEWSLKTEYFANGNISAKTDARGIKADFLYDDLNRPYRRTYTATRTLPSGTYTPSPTVNSYYDGRGLGLDPASIPLTLLGKNTRVSSSVSETRYTGFDAMGNVTSSEQLIDGRTYQMPSYTYNYAGALVTQTYPSGRVVKNDYDDGGVLSVVSGQAQGQAWKTYASDFDYSLTNTGATSRMKLGNGRWESVVYNKRLQPTLVGLGTAQNATDLMKLEYVYGTAQHDNGNITSQTITVPTSGTSSGFTAVQTYGYDNLNRLTSAIETPAGQPTQPTWQQTFTYDQFGNRTVVTSGTNATTPGLVGDNPTIDGATNRITPRTGEQYQYDADGNLLKDRAGNSYSFNSDDMQATFTYSGAGQAAAQYFYDGEGRRVKKVDGGETTVFVYNANGQLVAEYSSNAQPVSNPTTYLTSDTLGSPRVNTGADGSVVARHDYLPFGEEIEAYGGRINHAEYRTDTVRQKFAGYQHDSENGLDYAQARYYSSKAGRFTSVDPLMASASVADPQSFNRYAYALNGPYRYTDPSGMAVDGEGWSADDYFAFSNAMADEAEDQKRAAREAEKEAQRKQQQQQQQGQQGQQQTGPQNNQQGDAPQHPDLRRDGDPANAAIDDALKALFTDGENGLVVGADAHVNKLRDGSHYETADGLLHTIHVYGDETGNKLVGVYAPKEFSVIKYEGGKNGIVTATNPKTGEVLGFAHVNVTKSQLEKNILHTNGAESRYLGTIGGPGAPDKGNRHSHITYYANADARREARSNKIATDTKMTDFGSADAAAGRLRDFRKLVQK